MTELIEKRIAPAVARRRAVTVYGACARARAGFRTRLTLYGLIQKRRATVFFASESHPNSSKYTWWRRLPHCFGPPCRKQSTNRFRKLGSVFRVTMGRI